MIANPIIFISYSHKDKDWVRNWLLPRVEKEGLKTHIDFRDFEIGVPFLRSMERAYETCAKVLLVCTENWINSEFAQFESYLFQSEDPNGYRKKTLPLVLHECKLPPRIKILNYADFREESNWDFELTKLIEQIKKDFAELKIEKESYPPIPEENVDIVRLPQTGYELFGRQKELALLNEAWESETLNVIAFVAYGGTGKSTLVNKWLEKMRWDNYRGAKRVFAWSFYSQGTGERVTSADLFIKEALVWFGDEHPEAGSPWDKGKRLAHLIRQDKTLLILDGLEPLQSYLDVEKGKIKDPALAVLVTELAKNNNGLCIITTREEIPDIQRFSSTAQQINLEQISDEAGRALLRVRGIRGTDAELEVVTRAFGNHALAINLLAEYLHLIPGHPAKKAHEIPDLDIPEKQGKHPRRVIEAFATHFGEGAELELLHILGLFDRPADKAAIDAVIQGEPIPGLTEHLQQLSKDGSSDLLERLRTTKLLARKSEHRPNTIDCHPLIREHFSQKLGEKSQKAWKEANGRLYEYFKNLPEKELPDTLEEMEPLFMAVAYGCRSGLFNESLDIYQNRIQRGKDFHSTKKLGAFESQISAISNFFSSIWDDFFQELDESHRGYVLGEASYSLWALGRLLEAASTYKNDLNLRINKKDWKNASIVSSNLSALFLISGDFINAKKFALNGIKYSNKIDNIFWKVSTRSDLAASLFQMGFLKEAENKFIEAEEMQKSAEHHRPFLYSVNGFQFCDLLLSQGKFDEVQRRVKYTIKSAKRKGVVLDIGNDKISLAKFYLFQSIRKGRKSSKKSIEILSEGISDLKKSGQQQDIPYGLIARSHFYRISGYFLNAWEDLEEAQGIAERGNMKLHLVDYYLEAGRLISRQLLVGNYQLVEGGRQITLNREEMSNRLKMHLEKATELVNETGYHRRDPELLLLQAQLHFASGDKKIVRIWLNKAKERFDEMGIRMWDFEVRELEEKLSK